MQLGILIAAVSLAVTACGGGNDDSAGGGGGDSGKKYVIGVSNTLAGNGWREQMICSVKAQALASGKVSKVIAISKNGGPTEQIQDLQNLISQGVNAIIVNPSDREKLNPVIEHRGRRRRPGGHGPDGLCGHQRPGRLRPPGGAVAGRQARRQGQRPLHARDRRRAGRFRP
jgi:hypothetical protein